MQHHAHLLGMQCPFLRALAGSLASFDTSSIVNTEGVPLLEENEFETEGSGNSVGLDEYIQKQSKVILDPNHVNSHLNIHHINFDYKQYAANLKTTKKIAKQEYMRTTLLPELKLREKDMNDVMNLSYTAKIELLQVHLIKEEYLSYIYRTIKNFRTTREAELVLIE